MIGYYLLISISLLGNLESQFMYDGSIDGLGKYEMKKFVAPTQLMHLEECEYIRNGLGENMKKFVEDEEVFKSEAISIKYECIGVEIK